jgi:ribosomal protein L29
MDVVLDLLKQPFIWGLGLGLLIAAFLWKSSLSARSGLRREMKRLEDESRELQGHLNTQLKLNAKGTDEIQKELDELRTQNENLRVNLAAAQHKPGRAELRQFHINDAAVGIMREQAPGFAPAWEQALRKAEADYEAAEGGLKKLVKKVIPGIGSSAAPAMEAETSKTED